MAPEDVIKELGYLTLGSRLKRLGERMQADVSRLVKQEGQNVHAGLMPTLGILAKRGPMTVGDLATALGIAQPGVTRMLAQLKRQKLVSSGKTKNDQRQRSAWGGFHCERAAATTGMAHRRRSQRIHVAVSDARHPQGNSTGQSAGATATCQTN